MISHVKLGNISCFYFKKQNILVSILYTPFDERTRNNLRRGRFALAPYQRVAVEGFERPLLAFHVAGTAEPILRGAPTPPCVPSLAKVKHFVFRGSSQPPLLHPYAGFAACFPAAVELSAIGRAGDPLAQDVAALRGELAKMQARIDALAARPSADEGKDAATGSEAAHPEDEPAPRRATKG